MFTPLFAGALLASTSRSAFIIIVVCVVGSLCFRSRLGTRLFYGFAVLSFAGLIGSATYLQDRLADTTESLIAMAGSRVNELRIGGRTQSISVQPKTGNLPSYEVQSPDGARSRSGSHNGAETTTAPRVWNVLKF